MVLGQRFETYWLVQSGHVFYIIDQHAGHERLTYYAYKEQILQSEVVSQPMLVPDILSLTFSEMTAFQDHQNVFDRLGFDAVSYTHLDVYKRQ